MRSLAPLVARYIEQGNLSAADFMCRRILVDGGDEAVALLGLTNIARRLQRWEHEQLFLRRLAFPYETRFVPPLPVGTIRPKAQIVPGSRYLVVNSWGFGFWSDVIHVVGCCCLAWLSGRVPVTNWRSASRYRDAGDHDAFVDFFEPLAPCSLADLPDADFFPLAWSMAKLAEREGPMPPSYLGPTPLDVLMSGATVAVCDKHVSPAQVLNWIIPEIMPNEDELANQIADILLSYCRPQPRFVAAAGDYIAHAFAGKPFAAFHLRGTDKIIEHRQTTRINDAIVARIAALPSDMPLFCMTDDVRLESAVRDKFGDRVRFTAVTRSGAGVGVHHIESGALPGRRRKKRRRLGEEILVDVLIAVRAAIFVGDGQSNVAAAIALLMRGGSGKAELLSPNQLLEMRDWGLLSW